MKARRWSAGDEEVPALATLVAVIAPVRLERKVLVHRRGEREVDSARRRDADHADAARLGGELDDRAPDGARASLGPTGRRSARHPARPVIWSMGTGDRHWGQALGTGTGDIGPSPVRSRYRCRAQSAHPMSAMRPWRDGTKGRAAPEPPSARVVRSGERVAPRCTTTPGRGAPRRPTDGGAPGAAAGKHARQDRWRRANPRRQSAWRRALSS